METGRRDNGWRTALVLGGARSGKSVRAESMAEATGLQKIYVATAEAWDDEMRARIAQHRERRDASWTNVDAPHDLCGALKIHDAHKNVILIDCLTLWLTNVMLAETDLDAAPSALLQTIQDSQSRLVFVTNEVGLGIVPDNPLARRFRDAQGRLNQQVAAAVDHVVFMAAGLPLVMKG